MHKSHEMLFHCLSNSQEARNFRLLFELNSRIIVPAQHCCRKTEIVLLVVCIQADRIHSNNNFTITRQLQLEVAFAFINCSETCFLTLLTPLPHIRTADWSVAGGLHSNPSRKEGTEQWRFSRFANLHCCLTQGTNTGARLEQVDSIKTRFNQVLLQQWV